MLLESSGGSLLGVCVWGKGIYSPYPVADWLLQAVCSCVAVIATVSFGVAHITVVLRRARYVRASLRP